MNSQCLMYLVDVVNKFYIRSDHFDAYDIDIIGKNSQGLRPNAKLTQ